MKKYLYFSLAAVALASCTSDEFVGEDPGPNNVTNETPKAIDFGSLTGKATRASLEGSAAAAKLNNNFIVYGFKTNSATEAADGSTDQKVFDLYNVNYTAGTAGTTESNTANWEYVGYTPHTAGGSTATEQTIKYWDYSADNYVFSAISGTGITAKKAVKAEDGSALSFASGIMTVKGTASEYDKGWEVTIPAGGSLSDLYASNRVPVEKANYANVVNLTFYNMGAKIRFAVYETVPGYSIQINKFYYTDGTTEKNSETNFVIDGNFTTLKKDADSKLLVTYYPDGTLKNRPKVTPAADGVSASAYGEFGTNIQPTEKIGTASNEATYDQAGGLYTDIIPMTGNGMNLKIDYTLTSTDGSGETIKVKSATAKVPANFTDWKANFAYTYLFKISDNTNGNTGDLPTDPSDPTTGDPAGLYPITFDACVIGNEDGIQETITSVADPSITTYQNGEVVTKNNEYVAGDIYFENDALNISNYHVYEVNNYGTEATTEEVVANWKNNFCVLTEVSVTKSTGTDPTNFIPLSDGTYIQKTANQAAKFTAVAGKTYVIVNDKADALDPTTAGAQCKIVKVAGGPAAASYTLYTDALAGTATTLTLGGFDSSDQANPTTGKLYLAEGGVGVIGAMPLFTVTPDVTGNNGLVIAAGSAAGEYDLSINTNAVNAGTAKGDYTVKFNNVAIVTITIGTTNELWDNAATPAALSAAAVTAGGSAVTAVLKIDNAASNAGVIVNAYEDKGVTVTNSGSNGEYTISATQNAKPGVYNVTIAGVTVAVTVTNYAFAAASYTYDKKTDNSLVGPAAVVLNIEAGTAAATTATAVAASALTYNTTDLTLTGSAGSYTVTAVAATQGEYTVTYGSTAATTKIIVNKYAIDGGTIARSTGRLELGVTVNGNAVNASAAKVKITNDSDSDADVTSSFTVQTNGQKIVLSGAKSTLTPGAYTVRYYLEAGKTNEVATSALTVN